MTIFIGLIVIFFAGVLFGHGTHYQTNYVAIGWAIVLLIFGAAAVVSGCV